MRALCSKREYCTQDIKAKVKDSEDADEIIASLEKDKYLSDARYAAAFARDKSSIAGWGQMKIRYALAAKGISKADIDAGIAEIDEKAALEKLEKALSVKYKSIAEEPDSKLKLIRFALGRGYDYKEVAPAVEKIIKLWNTEN